MIRLLILIIAGAIALALAYFFFKSIPFARKMLVVGGGFLAAFVAVAMQGAYPIYMPFLAIIGLALLAALFYMKLVEKQKLEKQRHAEERKLKRDATTSKSFASNRFHIDPVKTRKGEQ